MLLKKFPSELQSIARSLELPFSDEENSKGVSILEGSKLDTVWSLLSTSAKDVLDPDNPNKKPPHMEQFQSQVKAACDREIKLHAEYLACFDKIAYIDEQQAKGVKVTNMSRRKFSLSCDGIFNEWYLARARCTRYQRFYSIFEKDRIARVEKAISILDELEKEGYGGVDGDVDGDVDGLWTPTPEFSLALKNHMFTLQKGLRMNEYFRVQNCVAHLTGRPLFSPSELTPNMELSCDNDPYWRSPIKGTTAERMNLIYVAARQSGGL